MGFVEHAEIKGCPCCYTTPCAPDCACANRNKRGGGSCFRCCLWTTPEQRRTKAIELAAVLEGVVMGDPERSRIVDGVNRMEHTVSLEAVKYADGIVAASSVSITSGDETFFLCEGDEHVQKKYTAKADEELVKIDATDARFEWVWQPGNRLRNIAESFRQHRPIGGHAVQLEESSQTTEAVNAVYSNERIEEAKAEKQRTIEKRGLRPGWDTYDEVITESALSYRVRGEYYIVSQDEALPLFRVLEVFDRGLYVVPCTPGLATVNFMPREMVARHEIARGDKEETESMKILPSDAQPEDPRIPMADVEALESWASTIIAQMKKTTMWEYPENGKAPEDVPLMLRVGRYKVYFDTGSYEGNMRVLVPYLLGVDNHLRKTARDARLDREKDDYDVAAFLNNEEPTNREINRQTSKVLREWLRMRDVRVRIKPDPNGDAENVIIHVRSADGDGQQRKPFAIKGVTKLAALRKIVKRFEIGNLD